MFTLNKTACNIPLKTLSYIQNLTSDCQQQINSIVTNGGNIANVGYMTQTLDDTSSTQFGNRCYNKTSTGFSNTSFGSATMENNTTGSYNTSVGFISLANNSSGSGNTSIGYHALGSNSAGNCNTCIGISAGVNNTSGSNNICVGNGAGNSIISTIGSTCIGTSSDTSFDYSTAIGCNAVCNAPPQIMMGTAQESVQVPGNISIIGKINNITTDTFSRVSYLSTLSSDVQTQINTVANNSTFNNGISASNITFSGNINTIPKLTFDFLKNVTSDVQSQINTNNTNIQTLQTKTSDISWSSGVFNTTNIANVCSTNILTFSTSLNNISASTFGKVGYLSNVASDVQSQINTNNTSISSIKTTLSDISWIAGVYNRTNIANYCSTSILSFSTSLNNIATTTFDYLKNVTSDIQQQLDSKPSFPVGSVISFAGNSTSLNGFLPCNGDPYNISQYTALYNAIGFTYGGSGQQFNVPN